MNVGLCSAIAWRIARSKRFGVNAAHKDNPTKIIKITIPVGILLLATLCVSLTHTLSAFPMPHVGFVSKQCCCYMYSKKSGSADTINSISEEKTEDAMDKTASMNGEEPAQGDDANVDLAKKCLKTT